LAIEYPSLRPVAFLVHQGSPSDAKIYEKILEELKRRRVARNGDKIIFDRGYYSYKNYVMGISKFKIVPGIFPRKNLKNGKLRSMLTYPLSLFDRHHPEKEKNFFKRLAKDLINIIDNWKEYRPIRGMIEDIFKLAKNAFSLRKLHRYTER
jgi:hypothetical protein